VVSGDGIVRHASGSEPIVTGDAFIFKPGEPHQLIAGEHGLVMYVIADNPTGDKGTFYEGGP
jgi:quercetin dioxygenase-like cupin family protein